MRRGEDDGVARNRLVVPEVEDVADADLLRQNRFRLPVPNDPDLALVHFSEVEKSTSGLFLRRPDQVWIVYTITFHSSNSYHRVRQLRLPHMVPDGQGM